MDRHPSGGLLLLLRLEREQSSLTVPSAEVHDGLQPRPGEGGNHHQVVHWRAGGASRPLADSSSVKGRSSSSCGVAGSGILIRFQTSASTSSQ